MRWVLTASLIAGLVVAPVSAQRGTSTGYAGGFSASHGFPAPHMSGGFGSGSHFASPPVMSRMNFNTPPQYRWSTFGNRPSYSPSGNRYSPPAPDWHHGKHTYPISRYRQPYVPYFYARSTYLVPGLLNSYWDYPYSSEYSDDQTASYPAQSQVENNNDYGPETAQYDPQQMQDVPPPPPDSGGPTPQAPLTLIFKDGHSQQIRNYAMTRTTLYVLDEVGSGRRPEIPLDEINVSATEKTNQAAGVDFAVPIGAD
ncbi:hypothetical protein [Alloacidobacterium sp.]|uniref:hypothetical protein n=1 Tax=Alloacidobacterium sp. TaxID=2951999 RepID=UPI002D5A9E8C|nr:hypothetical protein [Alloacidobacterium sp.]HYK34557.1 hypothetical protein [Alloacidobacterium sp.]